MALAGVNRGTGGNATVDLNFFVNGSGLTVGAFGILCVAYDNSGTQGADPIGLLSDANGNTWTPRITALNDPGAASAGLVLRVYTTTFTSSSVGISINFNVNVTAKAYTLTEVTGTGFSYVNGTSANAATASPTITSSSITSGNLIFGVLAAEGNGTRTGDADTTNGTWSTQQQTGFGTTAAGIEITSQFKVVTATATQTYNPTLSASADTIIAWIQIAEALPGTSFDPMGMMGFFGM